MGKKCTIINRQLDSVINSHIYLFGNVHAGCSVLFVIMHYRQSPETRWS
jgi:hypothetical protein